MCWTRGLVVDSARVVSSFCSGGRGNNLHAVVNALGPGIKDLFVYEEAATCPGAPEEMVGQAWIFTESLRRTRIVSEGSRAT